jgi:hypothetical protein
MINYNGQILNYNSQVGQDKFVLSVLKNKKMVILLKSVQMIQS